MCLLAVHTSPKPALNCLHNYDDKGADSQADRAKLDGVRYAQQCILCADFVSVCGRGSNYRRASTTLLCLLAVTGNNVCLVPQ